MPSPRLTLEEFRVAILVPAGRSDAKYETMHRPLDRAAFRRFRRRATLRVYRTIPDLARATVRVTR